MSVKEFLSFPQALKITSYSYRQSDIHCKLGCCLGLNPPNQNQKLINPHFPLSCYTRLSHLIQAALCCWETTYCVQFT